MQGSDNADIWRFERDQYRKQLSEAMLRIEELEAENERLRHIAHRHLEPRALGDNDE